MANKLPKGTKDFFGKEIRIWNELESIIKKLCKDFGVNEVRTPIFEYTDLFVKSTGESSDIVQKEMYTFTDRGGKSLTLKPEGTPGAARAFIEHNMQDIHMPIKLFYITPLFRCERPQAGRMRQFHQFGVEIFGSYNANTDVEVICMAQELFNRLELNNINLHINSLGCSNCRGDYNNSLKSFIKNNIDCLCTLCQERYEKNPLRVLDCKNENCQNILLEAPIILDSLDEQCSTHFEDVKAGLANLNIKFTVNPKIVRGLDYYSRTVFEFISNDLGSQSTVCGGGRYDTLIENSGGSKTGAVGFGMGIERLAIIIEKQNKNILTNDDIVVFVGHIGKNGMQKAEKIAFEIRRNKISAQTDTMCRNVKAQLKYANKICAKYSIIIGDDEILNDIVKIKNMDTGENTEVPINKIIDFLKSTL
jgi:histidyl-tRNA synthetase